MANEREEGLAALQNGDFATAQSKLEAAIAQNPQDAQAHLYLGGVYHQQQRHSDAVRVLTRATELLPMSAQAQYNLGIALEALGSHPQALETYRKATALQDNYPLAQQGVERMQKALQAAPPTGMYGTPAAPTGYEATTSAPAYAPPAAPAYGASPTAQPYMQDQTQPVAPYAAQPYAAPPAQPGYAPPAYAPPIQSGYAQPNVPPGYVQPTAYGEPQQYDLAGNPIAPTQASYGQAAPGMVVPPPGPAGYQGQQWSPYPAQGQMTKEDRFDIVQAFKDWGQLIISPRRFFVGEEGATGFSAPLAMLLAFTLISCLAASIKLVIGGNIVGLLGVAIAAPIIYIVFAICNLIWAGIVHGISRLFGGTGEYSGTFRASVYSWAGVAILSSLSSLVAPSPARTMMTGMAEPQVKVVRAQYSSPSSGQPTFSRPQYGRPGQFGNPGAFGNPSGAGAYGRNPYGRNPYGAQNPFAASMSMINPLQILVSLVGMVWGAVLLGMGVAATQRVSTGAAIGTVIVSSIVGGILFFAICFLIGIMFAGMMASTMAH